MCTTEKRLKNTYFVYILGKTPNYCNESGCPSVLLQPTCTEKSHERKKNVLVPRNFVRERYFIITGFKNPKRVKCVVKSTDNVFENGVRFWAGILEFKILLDLGQWAFDNSVFLCEFCWNC